MGWCVISFRSIYGHLGFFLVFGWWCVVYDVFGRVVRDMERDGQIGK